jgi:Uma2 family endonuclease
MSIANSPLPAPIGPDSNGMLMTPEEFDTAEEWEEGYRYELVRGVLIVTPSPELEVRKAYDELGYWLRSWRDTHPRGRILDDTAPEHTIATRTGRRRADRVVWCGLGRLPDYRRETPRIAIEFVACSSRGRKRDFIEKRAEYAEVGIEEYWVIDRYRRTMTVFRGATEERVVREGEVYITDLLPGFELNLSALLRIADRCRDS